MPKSNNRYSLKFDRFGHKAGTVVYDPVVYDYGLASDDSRYTGIEHITVTLDPAGDYPVFTVARHDVEPLS